MKRLLAVTKALSKDYLRDREAVFFALLFPVILLVIFSAVFAGGATEFTIHVQNNDLETDGDPTELSVAYVESLEAAEPLSVERIDPDRNVTAWTDGGTETRRVVVVPEGFDQQVRNRSLQVRMAVIGDTIDRFDEEIQQELDDPEQAELEENVSAVRGDLPTAEPATIRIYTAPDDEAADAVGAILRSHLATFNDRAIGIEEPTATVESETLEESGLTAVDYYLPAFIAAIVMFNGLVLVTTYVSEFNQRGTLKRLVATPLRKREWIVAILLQQSALAVLLTIVMVGVAALLYGVTAIPGPLSIALVVVGAVAFSSIGITLGSIIGDSNAAVSLGLAIALPVMFLSGVFWEIELMPASIQSVAAAMPLLYFHRALRQLMILETTDGVLLPFVMLAAMAIIFVAVAVRTMRWSDF